MEPTVDFDELSNALAVKALANIGLPQFTVTAEADAARPETLRALKAFGDELAKAYLQGVTDGREGTPFADLEEAHEHETARQHSDQELGNNELMP
jgi:hypothetical protein